MLLLNFASVPVPLAIVGSVLAVSLVSFVGVFTFSLREKLLQRMLLLFVSFSTGALLGNVFLHLLPEIVEGSGSLPPALSTVLLGILLSFVIEKFIHWRHCHVLGCEPHIHPAGHLVLIGDAAHNFLDGILIATAYLVSLPIGIATTVAVILHEIPQEFGDFVVLLHSGHSKGKALLANFLSALAAFLGAGLVLGLSTNMAGVERLLLPLAAGNFLYIAGSDLIPELHKETRASGALLQLLMMLAGIAVMHGLTLLPGVQ